MERNSALQYRIELGAVGLHDIPSSLLDTTQKIKMLREYRDISHSLSGTKFRDLKSPPLVSSVAFKVAGGVLAQLRSTVNGVEIFFVRFASTIHNVREQRWSYTLSGFMFSDIRDFFIDPGQDLLIMVLR